MTDSWIDATFVLADWQNAYYFVDALRRQTWEASVYGVGILTVSTLSDYVNRVDGAQLEVNRKWAQLDDYLANYMVC